MPVGGFPLAGVYAAQQADAMKAWQESIAAINEQKGQLLSKAGYREDYTVDPSNPYGAIQGVRKQYDDQRQDLSTQKTNFLRDYGATSTGGYDPTGDGVLQRSKSDHEQVLSRIAEARSQLTNNSGLNVSFDGEFNPTGASLRADKPYGQFQSILNGQESQLHSARDQSLARGLGSKGLGAKSEQSLAAGQAGDRSNFKDALLASLRQGAHAEKDENTAYGRGQTDANRSIMDGLSQFGTNNDRLDYGQKQDEFGIMSGLQNALLQVRLEALRTPQPYVLPDPADNSKVLNDILGAVKSGYGSVKSGDVIDAAGDKAPANIADYPHLNPTAPEQVYTPVSVGENTSFEPKPTEGNYIPQPAPQQPPGPSRSGGTIPTKIGGTFDTNQKFYTTRAEVDKVAAKNGGTVHFRTGYGYYVV
jgi:hypothetical protein